MGVWSRILLRYLAGYLVLIGVLPQDIADALLDDPEVVAAIGIALTFVVEGAYALAKRMGWRT